MHQMTLDLEDIVFHLLWNIKCLGIFLWVDLEEKNRLSHKAISFICVFVTDWLQ